MERIAKASLNVILSELDDKELGYLCSTNKSFREKCNDDKFWKLRIEYRLGKSFLKYKDIYNFYTYKEYYINLMNFINRNKNLSANEIVLKFNRPDVLMAKIKLENIILNESMIKILIIYWDFDILKFYIDYLIRNNLKLFYEENPNLIFIYSIQSKDMRKVQYIYNLIQNNPSFDLNWFNGILFKKVVEFGNIEMIEFIFNIQERENYDIAIEFYNGMFNEAILRDDKEILSLIYDKSIEDDKRINIHRNNESYFYLSLLRKKENSMDWLLNTSIIENDPVDIHTDNDYIFKNLCAINSFNSLNLLKSLDVNYDWPECRNIVPIFD